MPIAVSNPLERPRDRKSSFISVGIHVLVLAVILVAIFWRPKAARGCGSRSSAQFQHHALHAH